MIKAISYSLFGTAPLYLQGALRNAEQMPKFYPDWQTVFFCERESVPPEIVHDLLNRKAIVVRYSRAEYPNGMFARFLIADDRNVERFVIRDVDSRPSQREVNAVEAWIEHGSNFHAMRDHPYHAVKMLGGLWGAKGGVLKNVEQSIKCFHRSRHPYHRTTQYGADQEWLWQTVWPKLLQSGLVHDSCTRQQLGGVPFPDPLVEGDFAGSIFSEAEEPNAEHLKVRNDWIRGSRKS